MMQSVKFTIKWTIATFVGFLLSLLFIEIGEKSDIGVVQGAIGGLAIALPQAFVLKKDLKNPWLWVCSSLIGWILITTVGIGAVGWIVLTTQAFTLRIIHGFILGAVAGFVMGLPYWFVFRQHNPLARQWILISLVSWAFGVAIGSAIGALLYQFTQLFLSEVIGLSVTWLVVAIITGLSAHKIL